MLSGSQNYGAKLKGAGPMWAEKLIKVRNLGLLLISTLAGCGGTSSSPQARVLLSIAVQPNSASAVKQRQVAFSVTGAFNQAPTTQANLTAAWASSDSTIATIDPSTGLANCVA